MGDAESGRGPGLGGRGEKGGPAFAESEAFRNIEKVVEESLG